MEKDQHDGLELQYILHHYSRDDYDHDPASASLPTTQELLENGRAVLHAAVGRTGWRDVRVRDGDLSVFRECSIFQQYRVRQHIKHPSIK